MITEHDLGSNHTIAVSPVRRATGSRSSTRTRLSTAEWACRFVSAPAASRANRKRYGSVRAAADVIRLASNYGGSKHPQWCYNLKAHPECEFGGASFSASQVNDADEYERLYELAERIYAGYGDYRAKTAPIGREIPIFRLQPR